MPIRNFADVQAFEAEPLARRALPRSTYDALAASAKRWPDAKALSFFLTADTYEHTVTWTYADLLVDVTRAANLLHELGVDADHPVAFVLPNLPETHFAIWGGEAAGVVLAINPLFEPLQIRELLRATHARVLVTLAPSPESDLWARLVPQLSDLPDLKVVATVDLSAYLPNRAVAAIRYVVIRDRNRRFSQRNALPARRSSGRAADDHRRNKVVLFLHRRHQAKTGVKIAEGYGLTEAACVSSVNPFYGERRAGSIGIRLRYQLMRAIILDDAGRFRRAAEIDEIGTLLIKGPTCSSAILIHTTIRICGSRSTARTG